jgi:hypothetical protein
MTKQELLDQAHELIQESKVDKLVEIIRGLSLEDHSDRASFSLWRRQYSDLKRALLNNTISKGQYDRKLNGLAESLLELIKTLSLPEKEASHPKQQEDSGKDNSNEEAESKAQRSPAKEARSIPINQQKEREKKKKRRSLWLLLIPLIIIGLGAGGGYFFIFSSEGGTIPVEPELIHKQILEEKLNQLAESEDNLALRKEIEKMVPTGTMVARFWQDDQENFRTLMFNSYLGELNLEVISDSIVIKEFSENQGQYVLKVTHNHTN